MSVVIALWLTVVNQHASRWLFALFGVVIIGAWFALLVKAEQALIAAADDRTADFRAQIADTFGIEMTGEQAHRLTRHGHVNVPVDDHTTFEVTYRDGVMSVIKVKREPIPARLSGVEAA
ncbi:hypothetical protein [Aeromicrobium sp. 179-A 4D2 NHS]|uniref:hypothetical protein n=1 Tax=Aeromicrobium sp. 179-A 4D2 NHS TaxID=3142375 RepID=UPI0039A1E186